VATADPGVARIIAYDRRVHRLLGLVAVVALVGCDAGDPVAREAHRGSDTAIRAIDAHIIEMDGPLAPVERVDVADVVAASLFARLAARPAGWERLAAATHVPELEVGRAGSTYMLIANRDGRLYGTDIATSGELTVLRFRGQSDRDRSAALLMFSEPRDGGKRVVAVACGTGRSGRWSCIAPIELYDGELRDDLVFKLGASTGNLELPPIGTGRPRRFQITFP